jgi:hypothetical protein
LNRPFRPDALAYCFAGWNDERPFQGRGFYYGHITQAFRPGLAELNRPFGPDVWAMDSRSRVDDDRKTAHERWIRIVRDAMVST